MSDNLPPGVSDKDLEPDPVPCDMCLEAPCRCEHLEQQMDEQRLERVMDQ